MLRYLLNLISIAVYHGHVYIQSFPNIIGIMFSIAYRLHCCLRLSLDMHVCVCVHVCSHVGTYEHHFSMLPLPGYVHCLRKPQEGKALLFSWSLLLVPPQLSLLRPSQS